MERNEVTKLQNRAENLRDYPGSYFPAKARAQAAMQQWRAEHPIDAAREDKENADYAAAEKTRREEEYKNSFIGRGLD
jgi:hypothetical protein